MSTPRHPEAAEHGTRKCFAFHLGAERLGIDIAHVHEIVALLPVTRVPHAPPHVRGVINLHGRVVPVLDLGTLFGVEPGTVPDDCMVVVRAGGEEWAVAVGRVCGVREAGPSAHSCPSSGPGTRFTLWRVR